MSYDDLDQAIADLTPLSARTELAALLTGRGTYALWADKERMVRQALCGHDSVTEIYDHGCVEPTRTYCDDCGTVVEEDA